MKLESIKFRKYHEIWKISCIFFKYHAIMENMTKFEYIVKLEKIMNLENITKLESIKFRKYHEIWKTSIEKRAIDAQVARFVYATNSSFNLVENEEFLSFLVMLHPGYRPPSCK